MLSKDDRIAAEIVWPEGLERTPAEGRESYPGDLEPTRKESFQSIVEEFTRWDATEVRISTASQHYVDRPNIPHQHDKPDDVGVAVYYLVEDGSASEWHRIACDRWSTQRENARSLALWARRQRLAERCEVTTARSVHAATSALPPGQSESDDVIVAGTPEPELDVEQAADLLGVAPDAPDRVVETAFQERVKSDHPDQGGTGGVQRLQQARDHLLEDV
jgi:hypothetical protein